MVLVTHCNIKQINHDPSSVNMKKNKLELPLFMIPSHPTGLPSNSQLNLYFHLYTNTSRHKYSPERKEKQTNDSKLTEANGNH